MTQEKWLTLDSQNQVGYAAIDKKHLDPRLLKQIDDMEATIKKLKKMVHQMYYPYKKYEE